ncbi:MAG: DUF438 domain-containing protein [Bacilli bacterium]|nr:DUF438 domain-containing protein [Bacilli bacterium]
MSEFINNQSLRREQLKTLIKNIHQGHLSLEQAKKLFKEKFGTVSTEEIVAMEHDLIDEGVSVEEIQSLCDVHAAVFEGSIADIHAPKLDDEETPGHPLYEFIKENRYIEEVINKEIKPYLDTFTNNTILSLRIGFERLQNIHYHYAKKEYLFFPHLEKNGITAPPKVMWGVDDEIRQELDVIVKTLGQATFDEVDLRQKINLALTKVIDMISKEENILVPMLKQNLKTLEWIEVYQASDEIGWFLKAPETKWKYSLAPQKELDVKEEETSNEIKFKVGALNLEQLESILNTLPFDMTFVDHQGHVKYFSQGKERLFMRPALVIGRHVSLCHPPASVHIVDEIIESFKSGVKDHEDFWIKLGDKFVLIRYFAVRNENNEYLGTLEVSQDIKPLRELEGEKRLLAKK